MKGKFKGFLGRTYEFECEDPRPPWEGTPSYSYSANQLKFLVSSAGLTIQGPQLSMTLEGLGGIDWMITELQRSRAALDALLNPQTAKDTAYET